MPLSPSISPRSAYSAEEVACARARQALKDSFPQTRLSLEHTQECRVLPDRFVLLDYLPKAGIVGEIGVASGEYSAEILRQARPARLHLIDAWNTVPNDSANEMVSGLLGDHFDVAILNPAEAAEQVEAGNLKVLGIGHGERLESYPDWPTFTEQGFDVTAIWRGVFVPEGTPEEAVETLRDALVEMRELPEFQQFMKDQLQIDGYMGELGAFDDYFKNEVGQMREHFSESS